MVSPESEAWERGNPLCLGMEKRKEHDFLYSGQPNPQHNKHTADISTRLLHDNP